MRCSRSPGSPAREYFTALSIRLAIALTTCRRSHATSRAGDAGGAPARSMPGGRGGRAQLVDRVVDEHLERHRLARGDFLGLDEAEVEQVVDDARRAARLPSPSARPADGSPRDRPPPRASPPAPRARRSASSARGSRWRRSRGARSRPDASPTRRTTNTATPTSWSPACRAGPPRGATTDAAARSSCSSRSQRSPVARCATAARRARRPRPRRRDAASRYRSAAGLRNTSLPSASTHEDALAAARRARRASRSR